MAAPPIPTFSFTPTFSVLSLPPLFLRFDWFCLGKTSGNMSTCIYTNMYVKVDTFLHLHVYINIKLIYLVSVSWSSYKGTIATRIKWKVFFISQKAQLHSRHMLCFLLLWNGKQAELVAFITHCLEQNGSSHHTPHPATLTITTDLIRTGTVPYLLQGAEHLQQHTTTSQPV